MNIIIVTRRYPPFNGGAEHQLARIAHAMANLGHSVTVLTGQSGLLTSESKVGKLKIIKLIDMPIRLIGTLFFLTHLAFKLIQLRNKYDILLTTLINKTSALAIKLTHWLGKPATIYITAVGAIGNIERAKKLFLGSKYLNITSRAEAHIIQANHFYDELCTHGFEPSRLHLIKNIAPLHSFNHKNKFKTNYVSAKRKTFEILWCGRLATVKNPFAVLQIATILQQHGIDFHINIVGHGVLQELLKQKIQELRLTKTVLLHGFQSDPKPFFTNADMFLLTSNYDASPNVLLEAMSCKIPVVATNVGGVAEIVRNNVTGLLIPANNPKKAAQAIIRLTKEPELAFTLSTAAYKYICNEHSEKVIGNKYEKLFKELLKNSITR